MRKFLELFSVNDPGWGNSQPGNGSKDAKEGQGSDQAPKVDPAKPGSDKPVEAQPQNQPARPDGPPDLDELWRDFNDRLSGIFGGKKKPGSTSSAPGNKPSSTDIPPPSQRGNGGNGGGGFNAPNFNFTNPFGSKVTVIMAAGGVVLLWIFSGFYIIQEGQSGVVTTFGKYAYTAGPGINWRMPWPVQTEQIVNVSGVRSVEVGRSILIKATNQKDTSMLTEDENIIDVRFAVQYRLKDPTDYLFNNRDPDTTVVQAAETAVREIVARSKMDTVLYEGREKIAIDLAASIQKILDSYKTGIYVTSVTVQNVQPPEQVQAAFDDAVKAGQDQERLKSEGQAYANDIIPRAKGTADRLIQEAEGYKSRVVATAEGDANRFKQVLTEYAKAPGVTRDRMYIDSMREMYNNVSKVLVDTTKSNSMLYLPLDKIIAQVSAESAQVASGQAPTSTPTGSVTVGGATGNPAAPFSNNTASPSPSNTSGIGASDKRDGLRNRDRGDAR
ncbi:MULTISPECIES: FtsH protease activity modulator HflK [unclassified Polynucleobacter]|uniref:FtsH protease activity modulator HflK n=1 Tax=unclassified Polynucleobacter TaxID=2640945 RepID=UPI001BFE5E45|nr:MULTISPECIES: FtsH protease activity modulator HflK [unclassified Polynucleobacter]MBU3559188.1 FtsH protease activity modulator HflK [Polynucleobacter sp. Nonnen-W13]QWE29874.1 FtsH protease activity modulator HflK [Polynucleobacter sp. Adler-ghost]